MRPEGRYSTTGFYSRGEWDVSKHGGEDNSDNGAHVEGLCAMGSRYLHLAADSGRGQNRTLSWALWTNGNCHAAAAADPWCRPEAGASGRGTS